MEGVVSFAPGPVGQKAVQVGMPVKLVAVRLDGEDGRGHAVTAQGMSEVLAELLASYASHRGTRKSGILFARCKLMFFLIGAIGGWPPPSESHMVERQVNNVAGGGAVGVAAQQV